MKHLVIPDTQVKPNISLEYLSWIGQYAADKKPDVIVQIGDFADLPSLSSYDIGKKSFEGRTYKSDVRASVKGMKALMEPIKKEQQRLVRNKDKRWKPRLVLTLGNHEERIVRAIEYDRKLEDLIGIKDLKYESFGWEVYPFLDVIVIDGIGYSHYFTTGVNTVIASDTAGKKLRYKDYRKHKDGFWYIGGQRTKHQAALNKLEKKIYVKK